MFRNHSFDLVKLISFRCEMDCAIEKRSRVYLVENWEDNGPWSVIGFRLNGFRVVRGIVLG